MSDRDTNKTPLEAALEGTDDAHAYIAEELRRMVAGEGEYRRFTYCSKWIKNIWSAAADIIQANKNHDILH